MSGQKQKGFGYGGFAIKPKGIGLETQLAQMGYGLPSMSGRSHSSVLHIGKKRVRSEDESVLLWIVIVVTVKSKFLVYNLYICISVVYLRPLLKSNCISGSLSRKLL